MPDSQKISEKQSEYMNLIAEIMDIRKEERSLLRISEHTAASRMWLIVKKLRVCLNSRDLSFQMNRIMRISYFSIPVP